RGTSISLEALFQAAYWHQRKAVAARPSARSIGIGKYPGGMNQRQAGCDEAQCQGDRKGSPPISVNSRARATARARPYYTTNRPVKPVERLAPVLGGAG